jgi:hypothetical protein
MNGIAIDQVYERIPIQGIGLDHMYNRIPMHGIAIDHVYKRIPMQGIGLDRVYKRVSIHGIAFDHGSKTIPTHPIALGSTPSAISRQTTGQEVCPMKGRCKLPPTSQSGNPPTIPIFSLHPSNFPAA